MKNTATRERQNRKLYMYYDEFNNFLKLRLSKGKKKRPKDVHQNINNGMIVGIFLILLLIFQMFLTTFKCNYF